MTQDEALEKLELEIGASQQEIQRQYQEFYNEFQMRITNAPTTHQKNLYQKKFKQLENAFKVLTGKSIENLDEDLPGISFSDIKKDHSNTFSFKPTKEACLKLLELKEPIIKGKLEDAFRVKKRSCELGIKNALNKDIAKSFKSALDKYEQSYAVLKPLAVQTQANLSLNKTEKKTYKNRIPKVFTFLSFLVIGSYFMFFQKQKNGSEERKFSIYEKGNLLGYKQGEKIIIEPKYNKAENFIGDSAKVSNQDSSFYINKNGIWLSKAYKNNKVLDKSKNNHDKTNEFDIKNVNNSLGLRQKDSIAWGFAMNKNTIAVYESYIKNFTRGNYKKDAASAIQKLKNIAEFEKKENALILLEKGEDFYYGQRGVDKDLSKAFSYFLESAKLGAREAQFNIGKMYDLGEGVSKNEKEAFNWYLKSANNGYPAARIVLGRRFEIGDGVAKDLNKAMKWYLMSANSVGGSIGQYNVGRMYMNGIGVPVNIDEAKKWFKKAAKRNNFNAIEALKKMEKQ